MIASARVANCFLSLGLIAAVGCRTAENEYVAPPPPEVTVARPVVQMVTPFLEKNGETEAVAEAEVRARVTGFIEEINFESGDDVTEGDILYEIESEQYEAAMSTAKAALSAAEAEIAVAEAMVNTADAEQKKTLLNLQREQALLERDAGSQAAVDDAIAANDSALAAKKSAAASVRAANATKESAEASIANAELDLGYTKIQPLISGRITKTNVKKGNLVQIGDKLATIVNFDPIFANFSVSDREVLAFKELQLAKLDAGQQPKNAEWRDIPVYLSRETDVGFPFEGKLEYVDPQGIDPDTGTLGLRAKFDNPAEHLIPGLFVTVRLATGEPSKAMLIPEYAISRDQRGTFTLTVGDDQKVQRTDVAVLKAVSGWAIIKNGLTEQSRVIIDGLQRARPGLQVTPLDKELVVDDESLLRGIKPSARDDHSEPESNSPDSSATE